MATKREPQTLAERELPSSIEAEQAVLGAILMNNNAYLRVADILRVDHFFDPWHARLYDLCQELILQGKAATPVTLHTYLPADENVAPDMTVRQYVAKLAASAVTIINAPDYAQGIVRMWAFREAIKQAREAIDWAWYAPPDTDPSDVTTFLASQMLAIEAGLSASELATSSAEDVVDGIMSDNRPMAGRVVPLPPMLPQIRDCLNGDLEAGNLYGMLSASGEGKTSLMLQIVEYAASQGHPVLVMSYDQTAAQSFRQMAAQQIGIEAPRLADPSTLTEKEVDIYHIELKRLRKLPILYRKCSYQKDDAKAIRAYVAGFHANLAKKHEKVGLVILDHVRKVKPSDPRAQEGRIAADTNGIFKEAAGQYNVAWLSLAQRSSEGVKRENPRPLGRDMFGGQQALEDYDGIFYVYRAWIYYQEQLATVKNDFEKKEIHKRFANAQENYAEIGSIKVRYGKRERFKVEFDAQHTRYRSLRDTPTADGTAPSVSEQDAEEAKLL